jgi:GR25 family glycosyltransferase involved in LPS biosynthesis
MKSAIETKTQLNDIGIFPELFPGTLALDAKLFYQQQNRDINRYYDLPYRLIKQKHAGILGCFDSHYRLWQKCIALDEPIIIFEEDLVVKRELIDVEFENVLIISINYDWPQLRDKYSYLLECDSKLTHALDYNDTYMPGTSGYIIKPHLAKILVNFYRNSWLPSDWAINPNICKLQIHPQLIARSKMHHEKESLTRKIW